jgi:hypothetical protein
MKALEQDADKITSSHDLMQKVLAGVAAMPDLSTSGGCGSSGKDSC